MTLSTTHPCMISRHFTSPDTHPYDQVEWETRTAQIVKADGTVVFEQGGIEVPAFWSETASNIVASKYFRGQQGTPEREWSVKQMIDRVVDTIVEWGVEDGYFPPSNGALPPETWKDVTFQKELKYSLLHQYASFNSPVWFNIGCHDREQQASACYILSVEDSMAGILEWYRQESLIFTRGSGAGINISTLRAEGEPISKGGFSSGPLSFMRAADASAFSIKSGGTTRRSARMVVMDVDHPDILKFIWAKAREEKKARALALAGYDDSMDGEIYATVAHQNCNMSVSVTDEFLLKTRNDEVWYTKNRTNDKEQTQGAKNILSHIAEACWQSGDPGLFFHDTINAWHTTPEQGEIVSCNPCAEFLRPPNEACNLASINLLKFLKDDNSFDIDGFCHTINVLITAQEILVGRANYPTPAITKNSHDYRTLGLGYANLGALLMAKGLPYDSDAGRNYAATITALMTGQAYKRSAELATIKGPFAGFETNKVPMMDVILKHADALGNLEKTPLAAAACEAWNAAFVMGDEYGFRNAQVTLLAPTGTISLMMDCVTTGIEPDVALVNYKKLVGGGTIKKVNPVVGRALRTLGFPEYEIAEIVEHVFNGGDIGTFVDDDQWPVFDCAFPSHPGGRAISWQGHVKMVAALQPFLSGGISKTINLPNSSTVEDIQDAFLMAWKLGCKSIAIYRDGCKQTQVLTTEKPTPNGTHPPEPATPQHKQAIVTRAEMNLAVAALDDLKTKLGPQRKRLPDERPAINHKGSIGGTELYLTVGLYDNGQPGELFIKMAKEGSTLAGFADALGCMISISLQFGVPLTTICSKLQHTRFEPSGFTTNKELPLASSVVDYIARWLQKKFVDGVTAAIPSVVAQDKPGSTISSGEGSYTSLHFEGSDVALTQSQTGHALDTPICAECGSLTRKTGNCAVCETCGTSAGCT